METTKAKTTSERGKIATASVFGISTLALVLLFSLGIGEQRSARSAKGAEASQVSTSLETYESDSVARQASNPAETPDSDSTGLQGKMPGHSELSLQLD